MENGTYSKQDRRKNIVHCHIILLSYENILRSENTIEIRSIFECSWFIRMKLTLLQAQQWI